MTGPVQDILARLGSNGHAMPDHLAAKLCDTLVCYGVPRAEAQALADYAQHDKVPGAAVDPRG